MSELSVQEEIDKYNRKELRLYELSPDARAIVTNSSEQDRLGFTPDFVFRAAGTSMEKQRQTSLAAVQKLVAPNEVPPMQFEPEPTNPYDQHALKILVATARDSSGRYTCFEEIGYVPRGQCPNCGKSLTGKTFDTADHCPGCKAPLRTADGQFIDPKTHLNVYIGKLYREGRIKFSVESVTSAPGKPTLGLAVAIKVLN